VNLLKSISLQQWKRKGNNILITIIQKEAITLIKVKKLIYNKEIASPAALSQCRVILKIKYLHYIKNLFCKFAILN
jgi:hypothetical protein